MNGARTTTHVEFLVESVNATGRRDRVSIPSTQASTPELACETVRSFCRHSDEFPLREVRCVGVRTTVLTLFPGDDYCADHDMYACVFPHAR